MTAAIILIQNKIRRALQAPLYDAVKTAGILLVGTTEPAIRWPGVPWDAKKQPGRYFSAEVSFSGIIIHEVGPTPLTEGRGHVTVNCRTPANEGEDANDALARIVASAYPYGSTPSFDGISVNIDKMVPGGYGSDGPWTTGLVSVLWNVYRRP